MAALSPTKVHFCDCYHDPNGRPEGSIVVGAIVFDNVLSFKTKILLKRAVHENILPNISDSQ